MEYIYSALVLHKLGKEINADNLKIVLSAAGIQVGPEEETKIKALVASLKGVDIEKELEKASIVSAAPIAGSAPTAEKKEEKPKEEKKVAAAEGLSALFG